MSAKLSILDTHGLGQSRPLSLMIADDHPIFRSGLKLALERCAEVGSVRDVASFTELLSLLGGWFPDILIVDLNMPDFKIPESLRVLRHHHTAIPVLILSASSDTEDVMRTLRAGASGYITKAADISGLLDAIRVILGGGVFLPNDLLAGHAEVIGAARGEPRDPPAPRLTRRQFEVLTLTLEGHANKQIAFRLALSEGTVKAHLAAIMRVYNVNNRMQLLREVERASYKRWE